MAEALGTLAELRAALDSGATSAARLVERALARGAELEPRLHALLHVRRERALSCTERGMVHSSLRCLSLRKPLS